MLHDDVAATLPELRAHAESRMQRPCVARPVVGVTADPETGADVVEYGPPVYEGMCRLRNRSNGTLGNSRESGGATVDVTSREWHIPVDAPRIPIGTVIFFDDLPAYRTTDVADGDDMTARRYPVQVVTSS